MTQFEIPVVLILFKRKDAALQVLQQIRKRRPTKLYLLSDEGRDQAERQLVAQVREAVESAVDWDCEVIRWYADKNRGVYGNIALGAKSVFEREKWAIFLEDDNVPEYTFFDYCNELLKRFESDPKVLWICGTNYMERYKPAENASYVFTQHLLPCGWASWSSKFLENYQFELSSVTDRNLRKSVAKSYKSRALYRQQLRSVEAEHRRAQSNRPYISWDYHMLWSIRASGMFGASPAVNQIRNIGADEHAEHGGTSLDFEMTRRFVGIDSAPLPETLVHPSSVVVDKEYERKVSRIMLNPFGMRMKAAMRRLLVWIFRLPKDASVTQEFRNLLGSRLKNGL